MHGEVGLVGLFRLGKPRCSGSASRLIYEIDALAICMPKKLFQKGHDPRRNTKGRKGVRGVQIPDLLRRMGDRRLPPDLRKRLEASLVIPSSDLAKDVTRLEALMEAVYWCALRGESWAVQFIAERTEGKVKDTLALEGGARLEIVEELVDGS